MFKKALQIATTLGVLFMGYAGYTRGFAVVATWIRPSYDGPIVDIVQVASEGRIAAARLAELCYGPDHWASKANLQWYDQKGGYFLFTNDYIVPPESEGKRIILKPFALIAPSKDGKSHKVIIADEAILDFNKPFNGLKSDGKAAPYIVHGVMRGTTGPVELRDDKGTLKDRSDDLWIRLADIEYDEPTHQLKSDSAIVIEDRDMKTTAVGLRIDLRVPEGATKPKFAGAKSIKLLRDADIVATDAGKSGILPGSAQGETTDGKTPIHLRAAGKDEDRPAMLVILPEPKPPVLPGQPPPPPAPPAPTLAEFHQNVHVVRGTDRPDELDCDDLFLTLVPTPKPAPAKAQAAAGQAVAKAQVPPTAPADKPLTELTLRRAEATGHIVWLRSEAQGVNAKGNQLIHEKLGPDEPDRTYFRADEGTKLLVRRVEYDREGPDPTRIKLIDTIRTTDVTIFDDGKGGGPATVLARGPGRLESRATQDGPIERSAEWNDRLVLKTEGDGEAARRLITLSGSPKVSDPASGTLTARTSIDVILKPKPAPRAEVAVAGKDQAGAKTKPAGSSYQIDWMRADDDVVMVQEPTPEHPNVARRRMKAKKRLEVEFKNPEPEAPAGGKAPEPNAAPVAVAQGPTPAPAPSPEGAEPEKAPEKPASPPMEVESDLIWARVVLRQGGAGKERGEVEEVRLRNGVVLHQDPPAGKTQGTDARGENADLVGLGNGLYALRMLGKEGKPAEVTSEEFKIVGPDIGLDQALDYAWVKGAGKLTQMVSKGLLNDGGLEPDGKDKGKAPADQAKAEGAGDRPKVPMTISWQTRMRFLGRPTDAQGRPGNGKAEFHGGVVATSEDAYVSGDELITRMDRPVSFAKVRRDPAEPGQAREPEPRPQIEWVRCESREKYGVQVVNLKRDPERKSVVLEKQQITSQVVEYEKATGRFIVPGAGMVLLWGQKGKNQGGGGLLSTAPGPDQDRRVILTSATEPTAEAREKGKAKASSREKASTKEKAKSAPPAPPMELTQIKFSQEMEGRFGSGRDGATAAPRQAEFIGNVSVLHGVVENELKILDEDRPPREYVAMTSEYLRVISEPPTRPGESASNFLNGVYNAQASTRGKRGEETTIAGDQITYDSSKKLFYIYGFEGKGVILARSTGPGQPASTVTAESAAYNMETHESKLNAPHEFMIIDTKGQRLKDAKPIDPNSLNRKKPSRQLRAPMSSDKERRGFNGR